MKYEKIITGIKLIGMSCVNIIVGCIGYIILQDKLLNYTMLRALMYLVVSILWVSLWRPIYLLYKIEFMDD